MEQILPAFGVSVAEPLLLKMEYSLPSIIVAFWTFYIFVFVNTTAKVVNSYTVQYMGLEEIICQSFGMSFTQPFLLKTGYS